MYIVEIRIFEILAYTYTQEFEILNFHGINHDFKIFTLTSEIFLKQGYLCFSGY